MAHQPMVAKSPEVSRSKESINKSQQQHNTAGKEASNSFQKGSLIASAEKANASAGELMTPNDFKKSNYPAEDIVIMSFDHKNQTMQPGVGKGQSRERVTALWKGQSTLATLTTNPVKS